MKRRFKKRVIMREAEYAIKYANRLRDALVNLVEVGLNDRILRYIRKRDRFSFVETMESMP